MKLHIGDEPIESVVTIEASLEEMQVLKKYAAMYRCLAYGDYFKVGMLEFRVVEDEG